MSVNIEWVAHACFRVWRDGGPVVVMDPYNPADLKEFGLFEGDNSTFEEPDERRLIDGDVVLVSSLTDSAHGFPRLVRGSPRVVDTLELVQRGAEAEVDGSPVIAVGASESLDRTFEDAPKDNAVYCVRVGDTWIMHLGDLGHGLSAQELEPFVGRCDVMLAIVGVSNTVPLDDLDFMISHLKPKWVVPMHYGLPPFDAGMHRLSEFLDRRQHDPLFFARGSTVKLPLEMSVANQPLIVSLMPSAYEPIVNDPFERVA